MTAQDPDALEEAARRLDHLASAIKRVAQDVGAYQGKIKPIAAGVDALVGGSATGKDRTIARFLNESSRDIGRSVDLSMHASEQASRAAADARRRAQQLRRNER